MKTKLFFTICFILTGCGGESSSSLPDSPQSTLLADNKAPLNALFQQYRIREFELEPGEFGLAGDRLFLKVYLPSGNVLYLGQINKQGAFQLPLSLPNNEAVVKFDLFSDFEGDKSISREMPL